MTWISPSSWRPWWHVASAGNSVSTSTTLVRCFLLLFFPSLLQSVHGSPVRDAGRLCSRIYCCNTKSWTGPQETYAVRTCVHDGRKRHLAHTFFFRRWWWVAIVFSGPRELILFRLYTVGAHQVLTWSRDQPFSTPKYSFSACRIDICSF